MSIIAEKLGRLQAAAEHIEKGIASTPAAGDRAERHIKAAVLSEKLQRPQQALVHYLEVLRLAPNHKQATDIRLKAAQILEEKLDRPQEALAQFEEALRLAPGHPQAVDIRLKIGLLREALGRREDALRSFEEAIRADGEHPQAAAIRARIRSLREGPPSAEPGPAGRAVE
jgi:tetratricopeptide (TPR) repeat protein